MNVEQEIRDLELALALRELRLGNSLAHRRSGRDATSDRHQHVVDILCPAPLK